MPHDTVFQMEVVLLLGFAQIAAALSGFIGIAYVFGERSRGQLSIHDSSAEFHFMLAGLSALFISLLTALSLVCFSADEALIWRIANGVGAAMHFAGGGRLALEAFRQETSLRSGLVVASCGIVAALFSSLSAAGCFPSAGNFIFLVATAWSLGVTVVSFLSLITSARTS